MKNFCYENLKKLKSSKIFLSFKFYQNRKNYTNKNLNSSSFKYYRQFFMFPILFMPKIAFSKDEEDKNSNSLEMKEIVKGEYENRIRSFASVEKRFLVFAKVKQIGDYKMTYGQFLQSLLPFNYIKTKSVEEMEKYLQTNEIFNRLIKYVDVNNDNFINFEEFICLSVLLTTPILKFKEKFPDGKITRSEFTDFLMEHIRNEGSFKITSKSIMDGRIVKTDELLLRQCVMDFFTKAFNNDTKISIDKDLKIFKFKIYLMLLIYEFFSIPQVGDKKISMENFAKVLISYVNIFRSKKLLSKITEKKIDLEGEVTFDEYLCFFWLLNNIFQEKNQIFKDKKLSIEDFKKLFKEKINSCPDLGLKIKKSINEKQLKVMIELFDENGKI